VKWFRASAKQGYVSAQFNMGVSYLEGQGVGADAGKAAAWFTLAKENGDKSASEALERLAADRRSDAKLYGIAELGRMFIAGLDVPVDQQRGLKLLRAAASQGFDPAELYLCTVLILGERVPADPVEGKEWCERSVKKHFAGSESFLGHELYEGTHLPADRGRALAMLKNAAGYGDPDAYYILGKEAADPVEAQKLYLLGVIHNSSSCLTAFNENKSKLTREQLKTVVKQTNKWLEGHYYSQRIDPKKVGL